MKQHITTYQYLVHAALVAIVVLNMFSCAEDDYDFFRPEPSGGLTLMPQVYDQLATRAPSNTYDEDTGWENGQTKPADNVLLENDLGTHLDVFISGIDDNFWKEFHLIQGEEFAGVRANVADQTADLLSSVWNTIKSDNDANLPLTVGKRYDVYVAVNTTVTNGTVGSKEALLAKTNHNNIVHKLYGNGNATDYDPYRRMMMDGHVEWTPTDEPLQRINVPLKRAEAKVVAHIQFDPAFYASLKDNTYTDTPVGSAAWKYVNWCFDSKVFADGADITPGLSTNDSRNNAVISGTLDHQKYYHYQDAGNTVNIYFTEDEEDTDGTLYLTKYPNAEVKYVDGVPYCYIVTYDYCSQWGDNAEELAPYMLLSYPFYAKESQESTATNTTFNYYRIPLCDESTHTSLERNHIYKIDAVISGSGSTSLSGRVNPVKLNYQVIDWSHSDDETVNILAEKFFYFYVTPKKYELRGNDTQTVDLQYYAPEGSVVKFNNLKIYYYNKDANQVFQHGSSQNQLNTEYTSYTYSATGAQPTSIEVKADGTIHISSDALANKAVKYISFTAFTTYTDDNGDSHTLSEDVFIKHFPTDNIQSVDGWFSYKQDGGTARIIREYSWDPQADGWDSYDGYENDVEVTAAEYEQAVEGKHSETEERATGTPSNHDRASNTESGGNNSQLQTAFRNAVPQNSRQGANSENNAYKDPNSNYWYWGTGRTTNNTNWNSYDWSTGWMNPTYYRYETYNRRIYYKNETVYYARRYYRDVTVNTNWVIWNMDSQNRYYPSKTVYDNIMYAKVYKDNDGIYDIDESYSYNNGYIAVYGERSYTNNHMYIVQISSTSDNYILGRPQINASHQSQDHVVSPAFMIASQLGALSIYRYITFNASDAATHCSQYVEVAQDGTTYTGWRLPTKEEVNIILQYQQNLPETMANVLTAKYYYTLDGDAAVNPSPTGNTSDTRFVRCIRDLSPAEVNAINSKQ